jgi:DNA replication and repair protein RecF
MDNPPDMKIERLVLQDFRNLRACDLSPGEGVNILCGENGQGKTNLLESLYFLSNLSPIRSTPLKNLIHFGSDQSRIFGQIHSRGLQKDLSVFLRKGSKAVKVNGKGVSRGVDYFGEFAVLLFSPESLKLVQGGPENRRRFMDTAISRVDRRYLFDLKEYKKILEQRNRLLRLTREGNVSKQTLQVWNEQLVSAGCRILQRRYRYLEDLTPACGEIFKNLFQKKEELRLCYRSSLFRRTVHEEPARGGPSLRERFFQGIDLMEKKEIHLGMTQLGPHLDDVLFILADRPVKPFVSQGEARILALSLILSEAHLYRKMTGAFPVLLLDDVNSELDPRHQEGLSRSLKQLGQVFLTTTGHEKVEKTATDPRIFRVQKGEIFLVNNGQRM